jgi:toxin ParE1/3/4
LGCRYEHHTWSETAAAQLQAIRDYIARSSPGYAQALAARIVVRAESLASHPLLGAEVPEYADETIREVFEHPYRILYQVSGEDVQMVAVVHSARLLPRTPPV